MSDPATQSERSPDTTGPSPLPVIAILVGFGSVASLMGRAVGVTTTPAIAVYGLALAAALLVLNNYRRRCRLATDDG